MGDSYRYRLMRRYAGHIVLQISREGGVIYGSGKETEKVSKRNRIGVFSILSSFLRYAEAFLSRYDALLISSAVPELDICMC